MPAAHSVAEPTPSEVPGRTRTHRTRRLVSLDAFRGATIAGMILVNNPGSWSHVYPPLLHAEWHGWTPTDLIFPFFLFIVGVAMPLSWGRRTAAGATPRDLMVHAIRRSAVIFALGAFLAAFPDFDDWGTFRIMGVLQRIALVYLLASILYLYTRPDRLWIWAAGLLLAYWALLTWLPVPGYGVGDLSPEGNAAAWIDRMVLGQEHLWRGRGWDPEGLASTVPAVATTLLGILTGHWISSGRSPARRAGGLALASLILVMTGMAWDLVFPINKNLWTSSYVLFTGGMAGLALAACYWLIDVKHRTTWSRPLVWYGMNPLALFVASGLVTILLPRIQIADGATGSTSLYAWTYRHAFASWAGPLHGSFLFAFTYVLLWLGVAAWLYRKRVFIKV